MSGLVLALVAVLFLAAAILTAAEAAVFHLGDSRMRTLLEEGFRGAATLAAVRKAEGEVRAAVRLLSGGLTAAAVGLTVWSAASAWGAAGGVGGILAGVGAVILLTDVGPRVVATRKTLRLALVAAPLLRAVDRGLRVVTVPLSRIEGVLTGGSEDEGAQEERELRELQQIGQQEGVIGPDESELVERAFRLDELTAWDVMTPRVDVFAWKDSTTLGEIVPSLPTVPYSRVPVYGESIDDVTGILYVREAYQAFVEEAGDAPLAKLARPPFFVPRSLPLSRLLADFQSRRIHMGVVADEFGGIDGIVTLEDVLEELVGEIHDETDVEEDDLVRVSRNEVVADAGVDLRDINQALLVSLPLHEHRSLNGYILEELGHVPPTGEVLEREGLRIEILASTDTQVLRARLTRSEPRVDAPEND